MSNKPQPKIEPLKTADQFNREAGAIDGIARVFNGGFPREIKKIQMPDCAKCKAQIQQETAQEIKVELEDLVKNMPVETRNRLPLSSFLITSEWQQFWERHGVK